MFRIGGVSRVIRILRLLAYLSGVELFLRVVAWVDVGGWGAVLLGVLDI